MNKSKSKNEVNNHPNKNKYLTLKEQNNLQLN